MEMWQTAARLLHANQWVHPGKLLGDSEKRRDESRRGRQECLRHTLFQFEADLRLGVIRQVDRICS
jgi:hypothetical protein